MVSRRSLRSVTQKYIRQSKLYAMRRPRRLRVSKTLCDTMGLSQKEERDLKRALYASLQDSRHTCMTSFNNIASTSTDVIMMRKSQRNPHIISVNMQLCSPKSSSAKKYKKKLQVQKKFAREESATSSPSTTGQENTDHSPTFLHYVPKTEDFLTFLCLRG